MGVHFHQQKERKTRAVVLFPNCENNFFWTCWSSTIIYRSSHSFQKSSLLLSFVKDSKNVVTFSLFQNSSLIWLWQLFTYLINRSQYPDQTKSALTCYKTPRLDIARNTLQRCWWSECHAPSGCNMNTSRKYDHRCFSRSKVCSPQCCSICIQSSRDCST